MNFLQKCAAWINENPWKAVGSAVGMLIGVLVFVIGFWPTIIVFLLTCAGFMVGKAKDDKRPLADQLSDLFGKRPGGKDDSMK